MISLKTDFISQLRKDFPNLESEVLEDLVSDNLVSPFNLELPVALLRQAQDFISAAFALREKKEYIEFYKADFARLGIHDPGNKSMAMSYDFHVDSGQNLKLIEINTNASFLMLGLEMYRMKELPLPVADFSFEEMKAMVLEELRLQRKNISAPKTVITDSEPAQQKLYVEFLVYRELFKKWNWESRIADYREIFNDGIPDFIYNRHTDFLLEEPASGELRKKFLSGEVCLSPNPFEYHLLADKQRLIDWNVPGFLESMGLSETQVASLRLGLPKSFDLNAETKEELFAKRKQFFFKPKRAFGSKLSYRGSSISHKAFEEILNHEMIAQEFVPAPEKTFADPSGPQNFKYDLRCYAYQGRLQLVVARLYQGQVTNLRTFGGGFTCVKFEM
jgi:hypothetical protein